MPERPVGEVDAIRTPGSGRHQSVADDTCRNEHDR